MRNHRDWAPSATEALRLVIAFMKLRRPAIRAEDERRNPVATESFQSDDWRPSVAQYLADKTHVHLATVARQALGFSYGQMDVADWRRLSAIMRSLGWKPHKQVWSRAAPA